MHTATLMYRDINKPLLSKKIISHKYAARCFSVKRLKYNMLELISVFDVCLRVKFLESVKYAIL